jgi:branched-chain amino acid transport system ATP-binding protein
LLLAVRDLNVAYGSIRAVQGVSFEVAEGGLTCLLGPNGAGKTTTLYALAGILKGRGTVEFMGVDITAFSPQQRVGAGLVLVPEGRLLFPEMTVQENLQAGGYLQLGKGKEKLEDRIARAMDIFPRLRERRRQLAGTLSGGEQQMLAIARGLMSDPRLLMLDEPSLGLSPLIIEELLEIVRELNARGTTILLVEQNIRLPLELADRLYVLQTGRVVFEAGGDLEQEHVLDILHRAYLGAL